MENKENNLQQNQSSDQPSSKQCRQHQYEKDRLDVDCKHGVGCQSQQTTIPQKNSHNAWFITEFLGLQYHMLSLVFMSIFFLVIEFLILKKVTLFTKYDFSVLSFDVVSSWFAIYTLLPFIATQEDFDPKSGQKFWAALYIIICLNSFWTNGPWGFCR